MLGSGNQQIDIVGKVKDNKFTKGLHVVKGKSTNSHKSYMFESGSKQINFVLKVKVN